MRRKTKPSRFTNPWQGKKGPRARATKGRDGIYKAWRLVYNVPGPFTLKPFPKVSPRLWLSGLSWNLHKNTKRFSPKLATSFFFFLRFSRNMINSSYREDSMFGTRPGSFHEFRGRFLTPFSRSFNVSKFRRLSFGEY